MSERRWAWVEIDPQAVTHNVRTLRQLAGTAARLMAVVKADGYGHGAATVARAALAGGADRLGVATLDEAIALREAGFEAPIHLLSEAPPDAASEVVAARIVPTVCTKSFAIALSQAASAAGATVPYHLKIDTGMNRIGVRAEEAADFALWLRALPGLEMEGAFTHFATADTLGDWEFERQVERLSHAIGRMRTEGVKPMLVHAANSAATVLRPETRLDMVRCGIAIYGLHPAPSTRGKIDLVPAMRVVARVSFVKRIGLGEGVSYGFTYHASGPTTIATLPLGYADGVPRLASNKMEVLIGGTRCRQVGRVCMDQLMVEVPDHLRVDVGDEAVIVGSQGGERIVMDELADHASTINYEIACAFGRRLERRLAGV
ncbi:MAG: alanine racemase [Anaerosomatales bacterium]|nr:alanine racemase [Anaerosomatales bacterium]